MAGELNAALLTSGLQGAGPNQLATSIGNPDLAAQLPQLSLAQALEQQGLSGSPKTPAQAIGALGQALAGAYLQHQAVSNIQQSPAGASGELARIISQRDPDNPVVPMLNSNIPAVRMAGMEILQKAGPVMASPAKTEEETLANLARRARSEGRNELADAYEGIIKKKGSFDTGTPAGGITPSRIPLAPPPAAALQPPGAQVQATPVQTQRVPAASAPLGPMTTAERVAADKGKIAGAEEKARLEAQYGNAIQPSAAAASTEPIKTPRGTLLPSTAEQGLLPTSAKEFDQKSKAWQDTQNDWNKGLLAGQQAEQRLNTIAGALKSFQSGAWTTERADWAAKFKAAGLGGLADRVMSKPAEAQKVLHEGQIETLQQLKSANNRFSQMEFKTIGALKENPNLQPEANLQLLAEDLGTIKHERGMINDWADAQKAGWRDPQAFERAWLQHNKLSDFVQRERDAIGPLKGMKEAAPVVGQNALPQGWKYLGAQ